MTCMTSFELELGMQSFSFLWCHQCMWVLQAETNWRTSAEELAALKKLHDGVHGQLREALDRNSLEEQETIEVSVHIALV